MGNQKIVKHSNKNQEKTLDQLAYKFKYKFPKIFELSSLGVRIYCDFRYKKRVGRALAQANVLGRIQGKQSKIWPLFAGDSKILAGWLNQLPPKHVEFFNPHSFQEDKVCKVLSHPSIMTYGLFIEESLKAYALLKISPSGAAYVGRVVDPSLTNLGVGKFLGRFLYWQANLAGLQPHSTIHRDNLASLASHRANQSFEVVGDLPNNYILIQFKIEKESREPPQLEL